MFLRIRGAVSKLHSQRIGIHQHYQPNNIFCFTTRMVSLGTSQEGPVKILIRQRLSAELDPSHLDIVDESHKHASHAAMKEREAIETHFVVTVVSDKFEGVTPIERHRMVNQMLAD